MTTQHWTNSATTTLNGAITNVATSLVVHTGDGALFPTTGPFRIKIGAEIIEVGSRSTDTFSSLTRGVESTSAASHADTAPVSGILTAGQLALLHQLGVAELTNSDMVAANQNPMTTQDDIIVAGSSGTPGRLAKGSDGQVLTVDPTTHHLVYATPATGAMAELASTVLSGNQAIIDMTSISGSYRHLLLLVSGRTDQTGNFSGFTVKINNDAASNYTFTQSYSIPGSGWTQAASSTTGPPFMGELAGAGATAGYSGVTELWLYDYAGTTFHKMLTSKATRSQDLIVEFNELRWASTAAITRITLAPSGGTNFAAGTVAQLYGLTG